MARHGRAVSCHLCPTWRHSLETQACRLATPEEVAKIGVGDMMTTTPRTENASESDSNLWQLVCRGSASAFEVLVRRYQSLVCAVAYSACGNLALSEDVAQETFWTAWRQRAALEQPDRLKAWLCGIARNLAKDARRKAS